MKRILFLTTEICSSSRIKHGSNFSQPIDQLFRISNKTECQTKNGELVKGSSLEIKHKEVQFYLVQEEKTKPNSNKLL